MNPYINTATKAARLAAKTIMHAFDRLEALQIKHKGAKDLVTNIDKEAEDIIIDTLLYAYPDHGILAEEGYQKDGEYKWIIDPIDGTTNFIHGFPHFSISIALVINNRIEHGVIYDPIRDDLFTASRGAGAKKNNYRLRVSKTKTLSEGLIGTGFPFRLPNQHQEYVNSFQAVAEKSIGIRRAGSAALDLAYVAAGQLDGFWELGLSKWDIAAGMLMIKEAGGLVSDTAGGDTQFETGNIVAGNPRVFKELLATVKPHFS